MGSPERPPARADEKPTGMSSAPESAAPTPAAAPAEAATPKTAGADAKFGEPKADLRETVIEALQTCYDPEIPVNIYDLGLIYGIDVGDDRSVAIRMTLTSPSCPVAETLPPEVERKVKAIPGVGPVTVDLVWEPPWGKHLLSEAARLQLGLY